MCKLPVTSAVFAVVSAVVVPKHTTCVPPQLDGQNVGFSEAQAFATEGYPELLFATYSVVMGLSISEGTCQWVPNAGNLSLGRLNACTTAFDDSVIVAGGHDKVSGAYVGTIDEFRRNDDGTVRVEQTLQLPVGRELLGCASVGDLTVFAGGKPPHPPAPFGETDEVDVWNRTSGEWTLKKLSVERKKVEAMVLGTEVLMAGGEIGHHDAINGYSSSVDILDVTTGEMRVETLSLARQYFGIAAAGGKAFFAGGFANYGADANAGYRSNIVDVYDSRSKEWSVMYLAQNRSNLVGTAVLDRWVLFAGGTMQQAEPDLCNATGRSAVVDIYDTKTGEWSTDCLSEGRTIMSLSVGPSFGATAVFLGETFDLFTFPIEDEFVSPTIV